MPDLRRGNELAAGRRFVEILAEVPGPPMVLAPLLQVAPCHVEADRVSEDVIVRPLDVDPAAAFVQCDDELSLVVIVGALRRVVHFSAAHHEGKFAFKEEERRLATVTTHLLLMLGVVAADAEDTTDGKLVVAACDGERR